MRCLRSALAVSVLICFTMPTHATTLPLLGGPGGNYFQSQCPGGQYLVGFAVGSGAWLDRVAILCAPYLPAQHKFGARTRGQAFGGIGGSPQDAYCPNESYVHGIAFGFTRNGSKPEYVDDVGMSCAEIGTGGVTQNAVCISTGEGCGAMNVIPAEHLLPYAGVSPGNEECPAGEAGIGIHGRARSALDAMGLICGPEPTGKSMGTARPQTAQAPQDPWSKALQGSGAGSLLKQGSELIPPATSPALAMAAAAEVPIAGTAGARPAAAPGSPPTYPLACVGGGGMRAIATPDGFVRVTFAPAAQGGSAAPPRAGECAWLDRGFRPGEPQMLVYGSGAQSSQDLVSAANRGESFQVHAYNNNQGAMVVTSIDALGSGKPNAAVASSSNPVTPPPRIPPAAANGLNWVNAARVNSMTPAQQLPAQVPATAPASAIGNRAAQTGIIIVGGKPQQIAPQSAVTVQH